MFRTLLLLAWALLPLQANAQKSSNTASDAATLQAGDFIEVTIWREIDLSGQFEVDEDGIVTFPLLGERKVTDVPLGQLRRELLEEYRIQLRNPSINIVPLRKVFVLGAVRKPGGYMVSPTSSVIALLAEAEGLTSTGDLQRVQILRGSDLIHRRVPPETSISALDIRSGDQIFVGERNWLARNRSFVVSVLLALPSVVYTITRIVN